MLEKNIGLEAEFILLDSKGEVIIPPAWWNRDAFPILGEIRGDPGSGVADVVANFIKEKLKVEMRVGEGNSLLMADVKRIKLAVYKEAMRQTTEAKGKHIGRVKNINGINIDDYSDQIIKDGKIQGINVSCGLHIHFSCTHSEKHTMQTEVLKEVVIPLSIGEGLKQEIRLFRKAGYTDEKIIECSSSQLNRPAVEWIVREMDKAFFERFAPPEENRTKYRQPGFFELKPHGFEYRSLPANEQTLAALPEIVGKGFQLLNSLNNWD